MEYSIENERSKVKIRENMQGYMSHICLCTMLCVEFVLSTYNPINRNEYVNARKTGLLVIYN